MSSTGRYVALNTTARTLVIPPFPSKKGQPE